MARKIESEDAENRRIRDVTVMTRDQVKEIIGRVLSRPPADQEKAARRAREVKQRHHGNELSDEEWKIIGGCAARRDLATDEEVEQLFSRYRSV